MNTIISAEQLALLQTTYNLRPEKVIKIEKLSQPQPVFDVSLQQVDTPLPFSIFTNGIVTHNSFDSNYFLSIARHVGAVTDTEDEVAMQKIFGLKDDKNVWVTEPRVRYYPMSIGEKFFDFVAKLERILPDKLFKNGSWWLVYDDTKAYRKQFAGTFDEKLLKANGKLWIPASDAHPQALIAVDSYPAMMPEKQDVDDPSNSLASQARMFADNIKRIKSKMSSKRITIMGVNQIRQRPAVAFGCLHKTTKVTLADGTKKTIQEIVDNHLELDVLSYNPHTKKVEPQPVIGWYNNGAALNTDWLCFTFAETLILTVTRNHLLMDGSGYLRPAETFKPGDCLLHIMQESTVATDCPHALGYPHALTIATIRENSVEDSDKYDLQVAVNHLYVAEGIVVENSPEYEPCGESLKFFCFSADTLITTSRGLMYADELYYSSRDGEIPLIQGISGLEQPPVYDFMGNSELIELTARGGYTIKGKPGHRVLALKKGSFTPGWRSLSDIHIQAASTYYIPLKLGAMVFNETESLIDYSGLKVVGIGDNGNNIRPLTVSLPSSSSIELAYLLGYFVSEGHHKDNYLVLTNSDKELIDHVVTCYAQVFDLEEDEVATNYVKQKDNDMYEFRVYDSAVSQILTYVGLVQAPSHEKAVPWIIRQGTKDEQKAFLSALFEGDGTAQAREIAYFSMSSKLLFEVQAMLVNFGIYAKKSDPKLVWRTTDMNSEGGFLYLSGPNMAKFAQDIGFVFSRKQNKIESNGEGTNTRYDILPKILDWTCRKKFTEYVNSIKGRREHLKIEHFEDGWFDEAIVYADSMRTVHERRALLADFKALNKFVSYTKKNNLIWLEVTDIKYSFERAPTFDANMPDTHTILTNGIVSHNSDTRIKMTSRSVQDGKGSIEEEEGINGGLDTYRYIHLRAQKNKLSIPNLEGWARVWVKDAEGQAHGFDPVYDCVTATTLVHTDKGILPIVEIPSYADSCVELQENYYQLTGINALGYDLKYHPISAWMYQGKQPTFVVTTKSGHQVECTANHQFYAVTSQGSRQWIAAKDLSPQYYLFLNSKFYSEKTEFTYILYPVQVASVVPTGLRVATYDITVEDCNSFIANDLVVHNCFTFMRELGLVTGSKNRLRFAITGMENHKPFSWLNFKRLILGNRTLLKEVCVQHGIPKPINLRKELFKLFEGGKAMELYFKKKKSEVDGKAADEGSVEPVITE